MTGHDEKRINKAEQNRKKHNLPETLTTTALHAFIVSVNGNSDFSYIKSFIESAPAADARYLRSAYKKITPNIDLSHNYVCSSCDFEQDMEVPFTADFFWPK